jgi:hypothetical protein
MTAYRELEKEEEVMRAFDPSPRACGPLATFVLIALTLPGCGGAPLAPSSSPSRESTLGAGLAGTDAAPAAQGNGVFYPLAVGNRWAYDHSLGLYFVPEGGPPGPVFGVNDHQGREIVCVEQRGGHNYFVEQQSFENPRLFTWTRDRQDGDGLFEADVASNEPPTCSGATGPRVFDAGASAARREAAWSAIAARIDPARQAACRAAFDRVQARASAIRLALGLPSRSPARTPGATGVDAGEITRLEYPLHPGASWVIRTDPRFESTVEGADALDLAVGHVSGWRIRIDSEFNGPDDQVHVWYGRDGFLRLEDHLEGIVTDPNGVVLGRMVLDETMELVELSLNGGRFAAH